MLRDAPVTQPVPHATTSANSHAPLKGRMKSKTAAAPTGRRGRPKAQPQDLVASDSSDSGDDYLLPQNGANEDEDEDEGAPPAEMELDEDGVGGEEDEDDLMDEVPKRAASRSRKRRRDGTAVPSSPTKRSVKDNKSIFPSTPRHRKNAAAAASAHTPGQATPRSKGAGGRVRGVPPGTPSSPSKRKFAIRPKTVTYDSGLGDLSYLPQDPWYRAMHVLHVGSRPDALPCREEEFERVLRCVGELLEEGSGGCVCGLFFCFV